MVLEQLFNVKWIENKPRYAFLLGAAYSLVGLISAKLIFSSQVSLMYIAFTALLLIPTLNRLLQDEENVEIREKKFSLKLLLKDHRDIFEIYAFLFFGILLTSAVLSILLSDSLYILDWYRNLSLFVFIFIIFSFALLKAPIPADKRMLLFLLTILISFIGMKVLSSSNASSLFSVQLKATGLIGKAYESSMFLSILKNNVLVLLACLLLSFIYGAGSILFLAWNASAWGIAIGYSAQSALTQNPFIGFFQTLLPILPHMLTEAASYFSAAIVGGVVSKAVIREKLFSKKFYHIVTDALIFLVLGFILVVLAAYLEAYIFPILTF